MRADLTFVLALVTAINTLDTQTPVIRVLKFDGISRIARIRLLAYCQQSHFFTTLLSSQPGYLRIQNDSSEERFILLHLKNHHGWFSLIFVIFHLFIVLMELKIWHNCICSTKDRFRYFFSIQMSSRQSTLRIARKNINRCIDNRSCYNVRIFRSYRQFSCVRVLYVSMFAPYCYLFCIKTFDSPDIICFISTTLVNISCIAISSCATTEKH